MQRTREIDINKQWMEKAEIWQKENQKLHEQIQKLQIDKKNITKANK